jgi:O-antigen/teichoic acid export membrane protein
MIPAVSRLQLEDRRRDIVRLVARMARTLAALHFAVYALLQVTGPEVVTVLFTERYRDSWPILAVNLTLIPLSILSSACDPVLRAYPAQAAMLLRVRVGLIGVMALGLWLVTAHDWLLGAIVVMVAVTAVDRIVLSAMLGRALGVSRHDLPLFRDLGKLALAAALAAVVAAGVRVAVAPAGPLTVLAASGAAFAAAYVVAVFALGVPTPDERQLVRRRVRALLPTWFPREARLEP